MSTDPLSPTGEPSRFNKSNFTVVAFGDEFMIAMPLRTSPSLVPSTNIRNTLPALLDGTPACETVTPALLSEKTATPTGATVDGSGVTCTDPTCVIESVPCVVNRWKLRAGIE